MTEAKRDEGAGLSGSGVERPVGRPVPKRTGLRVACLLEQADYKPGEQAPDGYLAWHEWAEVQHKAGLRQKQCGRCGLWRYPQELDNVTTKWEARTRGGKMVKQELPVCLKCTAVAGSKTPNDRANLEPTA